MSKNTKTLLHWLFILATVAWIAIPLSAQITIAPATPNVTAPADVINSYQSVVSQWITAMQGYGRELFGALALIEMAWFCVSIALEYRNNIPIALLLAQKKVIVLGLFLTLLLNAAQWIPMIVNTFPTIGKHAAGVTAIGPAQISLVGLNLSGKMILAAGKAGLFLDAPAFIAYLIAALGIFIGFLMLTIEFVITIIDTLLAVGVGYVMVGFGGSRWTAPFVERYFSYAIGAGIKLMAIYMMVGLGMNLTADWYAQVDRINITSFSFDLAWQIMAAVLILVAVCWHVPKHVAGILGGSPSLTTSDGLGLLAAALTAGAGAAALISGVGAPAAAGIAAAGAGAAAGTAAAGGAMAPVAGASAASTAAATAPTVAPAAATAAKTGSAPAATTAPSRNGGPGAAMQTANLVTKTINSLPRNGGGGGGPRLNGIGHE